jgi:hypothetical protein
MFIKGLSRSSVLVEGDAVVSSLVSTAWNEQRCTRVRFLQARHTLHPGRRRPHGRAVCSGRYAAAAGAALPRWAAAASAVAATLHHHHHHQVRVLLLLLLRHGHDGSRFDADGKVGSGEPDGVGTCH